MSVDFDGSSDYLAEASAPATAAPLSLVAAVRGDDDTAAQTVVGIGRTSGIQQHFFELQLRGDVGGDPVRFHVNAGALSATADTPSGFTAGQWHIVGASEVSSTDHRVFIDGGSKGTSTSAAAPTSVDGLKVAAAPRATHGRLLDGKVAWVQVYDIALSDEEQGSLGAGIDPRLVRPDGLVRWWWLFDAAYVDLVSGTVLSATGAPVVSDDNPQLYLAVGAGPAPALAAPSSIQTRRSAAATLVLPVTAGDRFRIRRRRVAGSNLLTPIAGASALTAILDME